MADDNEIGDDMGRARRIVLNTRTFEKWGEASDFFSAMLKRYTIGARVTDTDAEDLKALLERHNEKAEKIGRGIAYFECNRPPAEYQANSQKCFWIVRVDETKEDFSMGHCLERKPYD